ncbi:MAG: hypothetical protein GY869_05325, partial [Planctomycetes bacterium]|nr:hypothetical protein [Planctomycetota bacterium]
HSTLKGQADSTIVLDGRFDPTTASTHDALKTVGTDGEVIVSIALGENATPAIGDITFSLSAEHVNYDAIPDKAGIIAANGNFRAKGVPGEFGELLADTTVTANGDQASIDYGASTSNGAVGYFHILGLSAGDTITILIEDSADDNTFATLVTCTLDGTALDAERVAVTGTVNRYVKASYTVTGSSISFPIAVIFVRK